ncbi:HAD-IIIC family phosphatase [Sphingomonas sp. PR090111-T3T-6A]|uniref:HAD-IIIC family phosphatase n=1 Tax=Sphingomonas sp. PR090111-T3T-6A TaxID=685778 RepID=UPI000367E754|nr:HAD-IIIC family phosphatase [Sphingomonas sp. PR090111-T3T-6A]
MVSRIHRFPRIELSPQEATTDRFLLLGTCGLAPLVVGLRNQGIQTDHILWESLAFSPPPEVEEADYEATVVSLTLLHIFADAAAGMEPDRRFGNGIYFPRAVAAGRVQEFFDACSELIEARVAALMPLFRKPVFFQAFMEPKHNYLGNLLPRFDLSNPAYFVQRLNEVMARALGAFPNAHYFDMNELASLVGRARIQDDYTTSFGHGSIIRDDETDSARIQKSAQPTEMWGTFDVLVEFEQVVARRFLDDLAILRRPLAIKAIIVDVDDTLWRGIAAEELHKPHWEFTEGWPIGVAEALLFFKARGGMLAMCSKNDEATLRDRWPHIYQGRLRLTDFASTKINFERKSENVRAILSELNILPQHALFIDDNPREIDEVRAAFPQMQFLSADHHDWRRKILMLPEMQTAAISGDAALRTASVQANIARAKAAEGMSYEEWLASLSLEQTIEIVERSDHPRFERAFELLNKTNQFNTTGRRWERRQIEALLEDGGALICSMLRDKLADNGMISVIVVHGDEIVQAVLSCRAFKYGAEIAAGRMACERILASHDQVRASLVDTGLNKTCHAYFEKMGFRKVEGEWRASDAPAWPPHIAISV